MLDTYTCISVGVHVICLTVDYMYMCVIIVSASLLGVRDVLLDVVKHPPSIPLKFAFNAAFARCQGGRHKEVWVRCRYQTSCGGSSKTCQRCKYMYMYVYICTYLYMCVGVFQACIAVHNTCTCM